MTHELVRASELLRVRRPREAAAAALRHLAAAPDDAVAHRLLALAQSALGEHAAAVDTARRAVQLEPTAAGSHEVCAAVHAAAGQYEPALASIAAALRADPEAASAHRLHARLLLARGDRERALAAASRASELAPDDAETLAVRARALRAADRDHEAAAAVRDGLRLAPDDAELHGLHGQLLLARDPGAAAASFLAVLQQQPEDEPARLGLLEALRARHRLYRGVAWARQGVVELIRQERWVVLAVCFAVCLLAALAITGRDAMHAVRAALIAVLLVPQELAHVALMLHPLGRHVLRRRERAFAAATGALLVTAVACGLATWWPGSTWPRHALLDWAKGCGAAALLAAWLHLMVEHGRLRRTTWVLIGVLVAVAILVALVELSR
ncbi:MAG: tetratricopeptide repeat protein [Planctomycetota bacterium]